MTVASGDHYLHTLWIISCMIKSTQGVRESSLQHGNACYRCQVHLLAIWGGPQNVSLCHDIKQCF